MKSKVESKKSKKMATSEAAKSDVALREEKVLEFWKEHDIFNKSLEYPGGTSVGPAQLSSTDASETKAGKNFVFYDGPPFATGLPHYGNLLAGTIKDAIPRFWTMNGYRVRRKWGWDCHGLPLENLIEKKLGLSTKRDIEEFGVKNFNEAARGAVLEYRDDWKKIVPRMGRWADMGDDYKTMDSNYTESVWWVFKTLHEKGLVYEGFKSMHLCPRCGTTLSNFEVNQGYKDIKDIAVTVKLPLLDDDGKVTDTSLLVWTTTPWTLPGNMAAAVHKEYDYVKVSVLRNEGPQRISDAGEGPTTEVKYEQIILAKERLEQLGTENYEILTEMKGSDLVGKRYEPPFPYHSNREFENKENAWKIYHAPYVELGDEGTGAVHLAPAYGEEDMELAKEHDIPIVHHVDREGHFMDFVTDFAGQLVKPKDDDSGVSHLDADIEIVKALKENGKLFKKENITHSYPHCWRCDTPLLNYATTSWFVEVTKIKDKLVAENSKVHWVPEHVGKNRFGKWLEGARDWAVSRQRYWGAPLPIWRNPETKEYKVFGSLSELQEYVPKSGNTYFTMRHGQSESNIKEIISANKDNDDSLTEKGVAQVEETIKNIPKDIDVIIHSGFQRTMETAEIVAKTLDKIEVTEDDRIRELDIADSFESKPWTTYNAEYIHWNDRYTKRFGNSENRLDVQIRVGEFLYDLEAKYKNKKILIVGHGGGLFALNCVAQGLERNGAKVYFNAVEYPYYKNAEVRELSFTPMPHNDEYALDYHRPYIDDIELFDLPAGKSGGDTKLERVPDVFDCWFESGSMPYGQHHYPFENKDEFEKEYFPAQFIAEGLDQTRGWFYSLIVLGTALFGKSPYQNVIVNGTVLAEDGRKMSKSLQNYPDPMELADRVGVDAMRFYLLSSPVMKGEDLNFSEKEVLELQRKNIGRLHNVLAMYETYEDASQKSKVKSQKSNHVLDMWIIARLNELIAESTSGYKNYELDKATRPVTDFIDDLSVWYLRRSRDRLKQTASSEAPALSPEQFASDVVQESTSLSSNSSLLASDTQMKPFVNDKDLALDTLRYVLQQLALVIAPSMPFYAEYLWGRVKSEDDAESVHLAEWPTGGEIDKLVLEEMAKTREIVSLALEVRSKENIKVRQPLSQLKVKSKKLKEEFAVLVKDEVNVKEVVFDDTIKDEVLLDIEITTELQAEGDVREFIRAVQDMRKKEGLEAHDSITLTVETSEGGKTLLQTFRDEIVRVTGTDSLSFATTKGEQISIGENQFIVSLQKVK